MDSRLLYSSSTALRNKVTWNDWIHFGTQSELDHSLVEDSISTQFGEQLVYLVFERNNSGELDSKKVLFDIVLGSANFFLWNSELTKAIEFNSIGILRTGELN